MNEQDGWKCSIRARNRESKSSWRIVAARIGHALGFAAAVSVQYCTIDSEQDTTAAVLYTCTVYCITSVSGDDSCLMPHACAFTVTVTC